MIDAYPMTLGGMQVATGVHPVGGNAMGAPIAPDPAGERGKGRGSLRRKSAPEPPPTSSSSIASTTVPQNAQYLYSPAIDGCSSKDSSTLGTEIVRGRGRSLKRSTSTPKRMEREHGAEPTAAEREFRWHTILPVREGIRQFLRRVTLPAVPNS